jgi:hypothetical protein
VRGAGARAGSQARGGGGAPTPATRLIEHPIALRFDSFTAVAPTCAFVRGGIMNARPGRDWVPGVVDPRLQARAPEARGF